MKKPFLLSAAIVFMSMTPQLAFGEDDVYEESDAYGMAYESCTDMANEDIAFDAETEGYPKEQWEAVFASCMNEKGFVVADPETPDEDIPDEHEDSDGELKGDWTLQ